MLTPLFGLRALPITSQPCCLSIKRELGFEIIGSFEDHQGFDGIMLGHPQTSYHLEFTHHREHVVGKAPSQEHLLAFYLPDPQQWELAVERMVKAGFAPVPAYNPYWDVRGKTFEDADGYRVVLEQSDWG